MINQEKLKDRNNYIGGSDLPIIMGTSKFKKPFELALEKADIRKSAFSGNIYTEIGNILEPIIQEKLNIVNYDDVDFSNYDFKMPLIGHIDGKIGDVLQEIKVSSQNINDCYEQYEYQIRFYMFVAGMKEAELRLLNRNEEDNKKIKEIQEEYKLEWNTTFENLTDFQLGGDPDATFRQLLSDICFEFENKKILKKDITTKKIKHDKEKEKFMLSKIEIFIDFVENLKIDPFFNVHNEDDYRSKEKELNILLGLETDNELIDYDFGKIEALENQLVAFKEIKQSYDKEKEKLLEFMQNNDIKKIDNDKFSITIKNGYTKKSFNKKKYEEENGIIEEKYYNKSEVGESLTLKLKGE